jgi:hypothetical protein
MEQEQRSPPPPECGGRRLVDDEQSSQSASRAAAAVVNLLLPHFYMDYYDDGRSSHILAWILLSCFVHENMSTQYSVVLITRSET